MYLLSFCSIARSDVKAQALDDAKNREIQPPQIPPQHTPRYGKMAIASVMVP